MSIFVWHSTFDHPPEPGKRVVVQQADGANVGELYRTPGGPQWFVDGQWYPLERWPFWVPVPRPPLRAEVRFEATPVGSPGPEPPTLVLTIHASVPGLLDETLEDHATAEEYAVPGFDWGPRRRELLERTRRRLSERLGVAPQKLELVEG